MADPRVLFGERRLPQFLGGHKVDRYIPPEVRQGIGALLQAGDMLNPVSAYREYIRDVGEGDVAGAATNLAGFVAPGAAGAVASRLGRAGAGAVEPYSDDAARALMEMLSPTGAPDDISRRQFMAGAGAAAVAPMLPAEELLDLAGRGVARGGGRVVDELLGLLGRQRETEREWDELLMRPVEAGMGPQDMPFEYEDVVGDEYLSRLYDLEAQFFEKIAKSDITQEELESLSDEALRSLADAASKGSLAEEAGGPELAERIYGVLASRRPGPDDLIE